MVKYVTNEKELTEDYYYGLLVNLYSQKTLSEASMEKLITIKSVLEDVSVSDAEYLVVSDIRNLPPPDELKKQLENE
jgi:hypothetical protein